LSLKDIPSDAIANTRFLPVKLRYNYWPTSVVQAVQWIVQKLFIWQQNLNQFY